MAFGQHAVLGLCILSTSALVTVTLFTSGLGCSSDELLAEPRSRVDRNGQGLPGRTNDEVSHS